MSRRAVVAALVAVVVAVGAVACSSGHRTKGKELAPADARDVLIDRNWLDRMPETTKDRLHVYRFVPKMGGGVYQDRTLFRGEFELFTFKVEGDQLVFDLPDRNERVRTRFTIEEIDEPPFDLELRLDHSPRGPDVYYGIRSETGDLDTFLAEHARAH